MNDLNRIESSNGWRDCAIESVVVQGKGNKIVQTKLAKSVVQRTAEIVFPEVDVLKRRVCTLDHEKFKMSTA